MGQIADYALVDQRGAESSVARRLTIMSLPCGLSKAGHLPLALSPCDSYRYSLCPLCEVTLWRCAGGLPWHWCRQLLPPRGLLAEHPFVS